MQNRYEVIGNTLIIEDHELGLDIRVPYEEGEQLHGPKRFYSDEGELLCESWFVEGKRQGRRTTPTSLERFINGKLHGLQEFFYPDGRKRSLIPYQEGQLHGEVLLYYPNSQLKRKIPFQKGKREGTEQMWDEAGVCILEASFVEDTLTGRSYRWYSNRQLAEEILYHGPAQKHDKRQWDEEGHPLLEGIWEGDFYEEKIWDATGTLLQKRKGRFEGRLIF